MNARFEHAEELIEAAQNELNRPAEDVVPFMVCHNAREAIADYFKGYILRQDAQYNEDDSLEDLLHQCQAIDLRYEEFDLSPFNFKRDEAYSAEFGRMKCCIELAQEIGHMVN